MKLIIQYQVSERIAYAPIFGLRAVSLCFFIWPPGGKFIIQDEVSERIAYALLFGVQAISLCLSFCLRAGNLLYKIRCPNG